MAKAMRAKLRLHQITKMNDAVETLRFHAVSASKYPADGSDEDNTYAKFSPSAHFEINVANPALIGQFAEGEVYYVDFTPVPAS